MSYWSKLSLDLGIPVFEDHIVPALNVIGEVKAFVPDFGAHNGMIIVSTFEQIEPFVDDILRFGYGFSVIDPGDDYIRGDAIEMLMDWGWTGDSKSPSWLV